MNFFCDRNHDSFQIHMPFGSFHVFIRGKKEDCPFLYFCKMSETGTEIFIFVFFSLISAAQFEYLWFKGLETLCSAPNVLEPVLLTCFLMLNPCLSHSFVMLHVHVIRNIPVGRLHTCS